MKADLVIGLDSSTTATKAIAFDRKGRIVCEGRASVALSNPKPGWYEQDVADWTGAASKALRQVARRVGAGRVAAVAISNQRESFAQFDAKNRPLRPGTLWLDERAHKEARHLAGMIGSEELHRISGKPSDITPCLPRCLWLARHMPKLWSKTAKTAEVHGVLAHFLTGRWATSIASADPMGLLDASRDDWSNVLLEAVSLRRQQLPELLTPGAVIGEVTAAASRHTGLAAGTAVVAGGGDGQCAGAGANIFIKGRAYLNLGTATVSGSYGRKYATHRAFRTMRAIADKGYSYETCLRTGTFLVNWMIERLFNVSPSRNAQILSELEREAARSPVGSNGLVLVPYWSGCMTPYWDTSARGVIAGFSHSHGRGDVYRALLEGIALEQTMMTNHVAEATAPIRHFAIVGGGAKSDLWCQIVADASGRDVKRLETVEASALGSAMAAATGAGWFGSIEEAAQAMSGKVLRTFRPAVKAHARYNDLLSVYAELWPTISSWNSRLQKLAGDVP